MESAVPKPADEGFVRFLRDRRGAGHLTGGEYLERLATHGFLLRSGALPGPRLEDEVASLIAEGVLVEAVRTDGDDDGIPF